MMAQIRVEIARAFSPLLRGSEFDGVSPREMKDRLQRLMDEYAGGTSQAITGSSGNVWTSTGKSPLTSTETG